jgi:hypothetical protein
MYNSGMKKSGKLAKAAGNCEFCGSEIPLLDFQEGRASVASGRICCAPCLDAGAWVGSAKKPRGADPRICRGHPRYVPTPHLELSLRLPGWRGLLFGNLARQWLDVSGEGLRAVVGRRCAVGDLLMARILQKQTKEVFEIVSSVRHVQETRRFPGCVVAGFLFANPGEEFRDVIRHLYGAAGIVDGRAKVPAPGARKRVSG